MKTSLSIMLYFFLSTTGFAKIVTMKDNLYLRSSGKQVPISSVNNLIQKKAISKIRLFNRGAVNMLAFAKKNEKEKNYSVDSKGFVYAIEPFASYDVKAVDKNGLVEFKQAPGKKYHISPKGFFLY